MKTITVPIGPGKGQIKPTLEALLAVVWEMRGHVRDLRDNGQAEQADLLEKYETACELIFQQNTFSLISGLGLPDDLVSKARKHHLAMPPEKVLK